MKIFNYLNLVGKEITTKEMELVRGGTSDSGGTCRANGCGANEKVIERQHEELAPWWRVAHGGVIHRNVSYCGG